MHSTQTEHQMTWMKWTAMYCVGGPHIRPILSIIILNYVLLDSLQEVHTTRTVALIVLPRKAIMARYVIEKNNIMAAV